MKRFPLAAITACAIGLGAAAFAAVPATAAPLFPGIPELPGVAGVPPLDLRVEIPLAVGGPPGELVLGPGTGPLPGVDVLVEIPRTDTGDALAQGDVRGRDDGRAEVGTLSEDSLRQEQAANTDSGPPVTDTPYNESAGFLMRNGLRGLALTVVPLLQFPAFDAIITNESGWNTFALNPTSGAYGLGQALPAYKMFTHGWDWPFNPLTQIRWTYDYMVDRYGGPDQAWEFWQRNHWY